MNQPIADEAGESPMTANVRTENSEFSTTTYDTSDRINIVDNNG